MTFPGNLPAATVSGVLRDQTGTPLKSAEMTFTPSVARVDDPGSGDQIYKTTNLPTCTTDATTGEFTVDLIPNDDPDESPINWTWHVHVQGMDNSVPPVAFEDDYDVLIPHDTSTVNLSACVQPEASNGVLTPVALTQLADFDNSSPASNGQVPAWNSTTQKWVPSSAAGSVVTVNGHAGPNITLGPTDVGSPATSDVVLKVNNLSDLTSVSTARTNLGLGSAATQAATAFGSASDVVAALAGIAQLKGSVVYVEDFGAVGNGTTDDTPAIQSAINTAVANAVSLGNNYAEVRFQAKTYACNGPLVQGGSTFGNSVLTLPVIGMTANCVTLVLKGAGEASALPIWLQTTPQKTGTVISTTTAGTNHATFGEAALIGGPNVKQYGAGNTWNNMQVVIDGIQLQLPTDPHICGFDFDATAQAIIKSASVYTNTGVTTTVVPTQTWQFGLRMPNSNNQSLEIIDRFSVEGCFYGLDLAEHTVLRSFYCIYCNIGINASSQNATPHTCKIEYANIEWCIWAAIQTSGSSGSFKIQADCLDIEIGGSSNPSGFNGPSHVIDDTGNKAWGYIGIRSASDPLVTAARVIGGANLELIDLGRNTGAQANPSVPAASADFVNPFFRHCAVNISGGTGVAVSVDGQATGLASGTVIVPSNKKINLGAYSVAPTWNWTAI